MCSTALIVQTVQAESYHDLTDPHSQTSYSDSMPSPNSQENQQRNDSSNVHNYERNDYDDSNYSNSDQNDLSNSQEENRADGENSAVHKSTRSPRHFIFKNAPHFRAAARLGVDQTRIDEHRQFLSAGVEASWIDRQTFLRPELGARLTTSIDGVTINGDKVDRVSNLYGFLGIGSTAMGLVGGLRFLVGEEWINIGDNYPDHNLFAMGGEARVGYEWGRGLSAFASYGLTSNMQLVSLDLGVSF